MLVPIVRVSYVIAASQDCVWIMCSIPVLMAYKEIKYQLQETQVFCFFDNY